MALAATASLALSACAGGSTSGGTGGDTSTVKIGFLGDLSGENAAIIIPPFNGATMAINEYNATNPKTKIQLVKYDSQAKNEQATALVQQAITTDKIVAMIGPSFSGESKATGAILEQAKIPNVSPSATNPGLAQNGWKYWHRVVANDDDQGPKIADFLIAAKSPKSAYVLSDDQEYSVGLSSSMEKELKAKGIPTQRDKFAKDASDYSSTVNKVKAANPDIIMFGGYYAQGGRLLKQLRDGGVNATFATGDGSLDVQLVTAAGGKAAEGAIIGCPCLIPFEGTTGALKDWADKYKKSSGVDPAIYATEGYDAATAFINAVKAGKVTGPDINEYLSTESFEGASKPIKFKANGEPETNSIFVYRVVGGKVTLLGPSDKAKLEG